MTAVTNVSLFVQILCGAIISSFYSVEGFAYLQLVQQWPRAFCHTSKKICLRTPNNFTLHGLWPSNYVRQSTFCPTFCIGKRFHHIRDRNLLSRLESSWPDLHKRDCKGALGQSFWEYQWRKHGTCSTTPRNYMTYFHLAVDLKDKHYILQTLQRSGIQPGQSNVNINKVYQSIYGATGKQIKIRCNKKSQIPLLNEIIICYDFTRTIVINCPHPNIGQTCLQNGGHVDFL